jgi:hypothetical protein
LQAQSCSRIKPATPNIQPSTSANVLPGGVSQVRFQERGIDRQKITEF